MSYASSAIIMSKSANLVNSTLYAYLLDCEISNLKAILLIVMGNVLDELLHSLEVGEALGTGGVVGGQPGQHPH